MLLLMITLLLVGCGSQTTHESRLVGTGGLAKSDMPVLVSEENLEDRQISVSISTPASANCGYLYTTSRNRVQSQPVRITD
jgi:hypothetical protein